MMEKLNDTTRTSIIIRVICEKRSEKRTYKPSASSTVPATGFNSFSHCQSVRHDFAFPSSWHECKNIYNISGDERVHIECILGVEIIIISHYKYVYSINIYMECIFKLYHNFFSFSLRSLIFDLKSIDITKILIIS